MEFLYKLYSNNYFGIGLFIVITILILSFFIILFFGKKDQESNQKENNKNENDITINNVNSNNVETNNNSLETVTLPVDDLNTNISLNAEEENKKPEIVEQNTEDIIESTFDPQDIINLHTDEIAESNQDEINVPGVEEKNEETIIDPFNLSVPIIEEKEEVENNIFTTNNNVEEKKDVQNVPFSSVYLNEQSNEKLEEQKETVVENIPNVETNSEIVLPKKIELPKKNSNNNNFNNIIKNDSTIDSNELNDILANLDNDSYNIEK